MNVGLLLQVRERILASPENYNQAAYCGTICCIAGHAVQIALPAQWTRMDGQGIIDASKVLLAIGHDQYERLCTFSSQWPEEFSNRYRTGLMKDRAEAAADAIIDFIITDGWTVPADLSRLQTSAPEEAHVAV
jgi:hypothetical protein